MITIAKLLIKIYPAVLFRCRRGIFHGDELSRYFPWVSKLFESCRLQSLEIDQQHTWVYLCRFAGTVPQITVITHPPILVSQLVRVLSH